MSVGGDGSGTVIGLHLWFNPAYYHQVNTQCEFELLKRRKSHTACYFSLLAGVPHRLAKVSGASHSFLVGYSPGSATYGEAR